MDGVVTTVPHRPRAAPRLVLLGLLLGGVTGCSLLIENWGPDPLEGAVVERDIAAEFEERRGVALDLDCPREMPVASGEGYSCDGTTADGEPIDVWVQIDDRLDGTYTWGEVMPPTPAPQPGG
ncbi:DUF4333 domain-containing protein [Blastococcus atacamensis]|uniref:DUF4333 domain-containing protein n=1 Tax=Blastococcus atacamensis TaxID=2070508 RepID=UPI00130004B5|nr:DUF4333 domain-containing protein [Blastococcus atacamensis]